MLWSLACNIAKRLLFETNNIASTVKMKPSSFYFIPAFGVFVFLFCTFFLLVFFSLSLFYRRSAFCYLFFALFFALHWQISQNSSRLFYQFVDFICIFAPFRLFIQRYICVCIISLASLSPFFCHWYVHSQDVPAGCSWLMFTFSTALVKQVLPNRVSRWYEIERKKNGQIETKAHTETRI